MVGSGIAKRAFFLILPPNLLRTQREYITPSLIAQPGLYSGSAIVSQVKTKPITLTAAMLANNSLSFLVQDDTTVKSATLQIVECCLKVNPEKEKAAQ